MKRNIKIILLTVIVILVLAIFCNYSIKSKNKENDKLNIVVTTFSAYDFTRQIVGDKANVTFLLGPGVDAHSFEPTANDLSKIQSSDVFIYIGGEMEKWTDKILGTDIISNKTKLIKISDAIDTIKEQEVDGTEEEVDEDEEFEGAFDEHIWTSPANSIKMMYYLNKTISNIDEKNSNFYSENTEKYVGQIKDVQKKIADIVASKKRDRLVFGDKMPMQYFLNEYGLKASAALKGCSTESDASAKTIAYLIDKVREEKIPVVLYIELSNGKTAETIAKETGAKNMQIQTLHNISKEDFENGETWVSLMTKNLDVLKKALD